MLCNSVIFLLDWWAFLYVIRTRNNQWMLTPSTSGMKQEINRARQSLTSSLIQSHIVKPRPQVCTQPMFSLSVPQSDVALRCRTGVCCLYNLPLEYISVNTCNIIHFNRCCYEYDRTHLYINTYMFLMYMCGGLMGWLSSEYLCFVCHMSIICEILSWCDIIWLGCGYKLLQTIIYTHHYLYSL